MSFGLCPMPRVLAAIALVTLVGACGEEEAPTAPPTQRVAPLVLTPAQREAERRAREAAGGDSAVGFPLNLLVSQTADAPASGTIDFEQFANFFDLTNQILPEHGVKFGGGRVYDQASIGSAFPARSGNKLAVASYTLVYIWFNPFVASATVHVTSGGPAEFSCFRPDGPQVGWDSLRVANYKGAGNGVEPNAPLTVSMAADSIYYCWVAALNSNFTFDDVTYRRGPIVDTTFQVSLTCPSTVTRADSISCNATWTPDSIPASEIQFEWRFQGDSVRVFPAANAEAYDPPPPVASAGQGMTSWPGRVVLGGRVFVQATWQGEVETDTASIVVNRRTSQLFGDLPVSFDPTMGDIVTDSTKTLNNQLPPPGDMQQVPGFIAGQNYDTLSGLGGAAQAIHGRPTVAMVPTGPNQGYWYVTDPGVYSTRRARVRTWLSGREQPKFSYSLSSGLLTNRGLLQARRKSLKSKLPMHPDSVAYLNGVWAHETYGTGTAKGHQGQIEVAAKSLPTCGRVPEILERLVAADTATAQFNAVSVILEGMKSLYAASGHNFVYGNHSGGPLYEVVSQVTVADTISTWVTAHGDSLKPVDPNVAPDTRWKCSRVY